MSNWCHVFGCIEVEPMGETQLEKDYILKTVLNHLPYVDNDGSASGMEVLVNQSQCNNLFSSHNELNQPIFLLSNKDRKSSGELSTIYYLTVHSDLRHTCLEEATRQFNNWFCRLSKRVRVMNYNISICEEYGECVYRLNSDPLNIYDDPYHKMFETPSWVNEDSVNWCEHLMLRKDNYYMLPKEYLKKYYPEEYKEEYPDEQ